MKQQLRKTALEKSQRPDDDSSFRHYTEYYVQQRFISKEQSPAWRENESEIVNMIENLSGV